jgi:hypothetical protein
MKDITESMLSAAIINAKSKADVLINLGYTPNRKLYPTLDALANRFNIKLPNSRSGYSNAIRKIPKEELLKLADVCSSKKEILFYFGFPDSTQNYRVLNTLLDELEITKFVKNPIGNNKQYKKAENYLTQNSSISSSKLRVKLITENIFEHKCSICSIEPYWNNKPLTLQLDHINGINTDNRLNNLRLVCPNCHSQTDNYAAKNIK